MSAFVESEYPNTSEIALKYALDYETKHQTNTQILQQQDNFDLRDRSRSPQAQFTPSHNGQDSTNLANSNEYKLFRLSVSVNSSHRIQSLLIHVFVSD